MNGQFHDVLARKRTGRTENRGYGLVEKFAFMVVERSEVRRM